jgi:NADPH-dependent curcumin reductase CurA
MDAKNSQIRLAARPEGLPKDSDWELTEEPVADPADGEAVVRTQYISLDPAMRGWMNDARSYVEPVELGAVMRALAVGRVVASKHPGLAEGDHVTGTWGVQEYATVTGKEARKIDTALAPVTSYLGALGMTGMTAYFGLLDVAAAQEGETVVVSGAAGAVGSVAGQIAKLKGCRVVGIAGGPEKCAWLTGELGFDAAIDYKAGDVKAGLKEHCPKRIDVYFDNVGGEILDAVLGRLNLRARIAICGAISQYNADGRMAGPANYMALLVFRARMEGFVVFDYASRYREAAQEIAGWMADGRLISREEVVGGGVQAFPATLLRLFAGENTGKLVLEVPEG